MATPTKPRDFEKIEREVSRENSPNSPVVQALQQQTANAFVLYANYKHYHWQTFGPLFRDLHKLFDELASEVLSTVDELAERIRMIGQDPPAHLLESANKATVMSAGPHTSMRDMVEEAQRSAAVLGHNFPGSQWYERSYAMMSDRGVQPVAETEARRRGWFSRTIGRVF